MSKNIVEFNDKGQYHGWVEIYSVGDILLVKGFSRNNMRFGYEECYINLSEPRKTYYLR